MHDVQCSSLGGVSSYYLTRLQFVYMRVNHNNRLVCYVSWLRRSADLRQHMWLEMQSVVVGLTACMLFFVVFFAEHLKVFIRSFVPSPFSERRHRRFSLPWAFRPGTLAELVTLGEYCWSLRWTITGQRRILGTVRRLGTRRRLVGSFRSSCTTLIS